MSRADADDADGIGAPDGDGHTRADALDGGCPADLFEAHAPVGARSAPVLRGAPRSTTTPVNAADEGTDDALVTALRTRGLRVVSLGSAALEAALSLPRPAREFPALSDLSLSRPSRAELEALIVLEGPPDAMPCPFTPDDFTALAVGSPSTTRAERRAAKRRRK